MEKNETNRSEEDCCGCTACAQACPKGAIFMRENEKGFLVPAVEKARCVECGVCERVCRFARPGGGVLRSVPDAYGVKKKTGRMSSQSGGAFALFAERALKQGGVAYGAAADREKVSYQRAGRIEDLKKLKGSKYVQASVGDAFLQVKKDLEEGRAVLFCGTPCHADGLLSFLSYKQVDTANLISCDLVCHGCPSPKVFCDYYSYLEGRFGTLAFYDFRLKRKGGWRNHIEGILAKDGSLFISGNYLRLFYSHLELRESCYRCPYARKDRISDLTVGDFWGIEKLDPAYDDLDGVSLVFANTEKGRKFAKEALKWGGGRKEIRCRGLPAAESVGPDGETGRIRGVLGLLFQGRVSSGGKAVLFFFRRGLQEGNLDEEMQEEGLAARQESSQSLSRS